jgi:phosphoribosylformylglycinamidine synthase PurS subunit
MNWTGRVRVMPRAGLLDPQGAAIEHALAALGFADVGAVRVGRMLEVRLAAASEAEARASLDAMCQRLIANPVTEDYAIVSVEAAQ